MFPGSGITKNRQSNLILCCLILLILYSVHELLLLWDNFPGIFLFPYNFCVFPHFPTTFPIISTDFPQISREFLVISTDFAQFSKISFIIKSAFCIPTKRCCIATTLLTNFCIVLLYVTVFVVLFVSFLWNPAYSFYFQKTSLKITKHLLVLTSSIL